MNCISSEPPPRKEVDNPFAIQRPHAPLALLQRQGSARFGNINQSSPFKRQLSLRIDDLPSTLERKEHSFSSSSSHNGPGKEPCNENKETDVEIEHVLLFRLFFIYSRKGQKDRKRFCTMLGWLCREVCV